MTDPTTTESSLREGTGVDQAEISAARQIVQSAWRDQALWSEAANRLKADLVTWRHRAALAGVVGAFLQTLAGGLAALDERWRWLGAVSALAGAIVLAIVPYVLKTKASKDQVRA